MLCPVCEHQNPRESARCAECWANLRDGVTVSEEESKELERRRRAVARRRRLVRWGVVALVALGVGALVGYNCLGAFLTLPPPTSTIGAVPALGDWPMYQRDPAHTAFVDAEGVILKGELHWHFVTEAPIVSSPAVVDGRVYLSTGDRRIIALDAGSGELIWEHEVSGPVDSSVAVAGDMVFVGLRDGTLLALNRHNGDTRWEFDTEGTVHQSPAVHQGVLYIGSGDFRLYALDAMTGEMRWSYMTGGRVSSSAAVYDDVVALTSEDKNLYILDNRTGKYRLDYRMTTGSRAPAFDGPRVFVTDGLGRLSALDWQEKDVPFEKPVRWMRTQLFVWGLLGSFPSQRGFVWSFLSPGDKLTGTPAVAWGNVYTSSTSGTLYCLDATTGESVWEFYANARLVASPSVMNQTVFVGDVDGRLYAIDALSGAKQWELTVGSRISSTPVIADGMVYLTALNGAVYAIKVK